MSHEEQEGGGEVWPWATTACGAQALRCRDDVDGPINVLGM